MSEYELVKNALAQYDPKWINQYYDLAKKLFTDLQIQRDDPRLSMTLNDQDNMPIKL